MRICFAMDVGDALLEGYNMYEDISSTVRLAICFVLIAFFLAVGLWIASMFSLAIDAEDFLQTQINEMEEYSYAESQINEKEEYSYAGSQKHPAEVQESSVNGFSILLILIGVAVIIFVVGRVAVNILYVVFPAIFKIKELESESITVNKYDPYSYVDDDSRYGWVNDLLDESVE